ncbi:MAG: lipid-A-disaccharide synthase [Litoreibacter sp.]
MRLYFIAGEPSGDRLGAAMMEQLKVLMPNVEFHGVGGPLMQAQGMASLFDMSELSVMGLAEVLPKLRSLFRRRDEVVADIQALQPDGIITIDSPDFCLRVAKKIVGIPKIHYVAPSVWAWRPGRAEKMRGVVDHVLALLPFEPPYMKRVGISCDFVGHPVVAEPVANAREISKFRAEHGLMDATVVLALPGSRQGEVSRLSGVFGDSLSRLAATVPDLRVVIPAAQNVSDLVLQMTKNWPGNPVIIPSQDLVQKRAAFGAANLALAASGTVSLELAASETPMVIAYDMNWISWQMMRRMALIDTVTLVNLVSETHAVPEFLGNRCRPDLIGKALADVLEEPDLQRDASRETMRRLGAEDEAPGLRAARSVLTAIKR